jgi:CO/xanthine dehydrogenase Mo-binding subunit
VTIGSDIPRVDGLGKLSGSTKYVDDLTMPGMMFGGTIRSQVPRGRITKIHFDPSINWDEYVVVDHRDITGHNEIRLLELDQPALVASEIRHKHEAVVLIAHESMEAVRRALRAVRIEVDPLPAVLDMCQDLTPDLIQYGSDNVFKTIDIRKGDPSAVFANAAHVVEGVYETGSQEHVYLETQGVIAYHDDERLVIKGTLQCPFYVLDALTHFFDRTADAFRVVQTPTGGGFGGKEDYPSVLAIHAALLCEKAGKPVKIIYDRQEDMAVTTKRHPSRMRHRTALDRDGKLLAIEIEVILDGGAYMTLSPVVLSRGVIHAAGPYACDNVHIHGEVRLTNTPPNGAFRGFGAPQTLFATERHMDVIAETIGIDPVELRRRNIIRDGQTTATSQVIDDGVDRVAIMDRALELADYHDRIAKHQTENATHPYLRRGVGFATIYHGAGFTGAGETYLESEVWVEGMPDGSVEVLSANTEMGQGTETVLQQIAGNTLKMPSAQVRVATPDTSRVPNSGPTVASRTVMIVGRLVERACEDLMRQVGADGIRAWHDKHPSQRLLGKAKYETPASIQWDDEAYRGDAYGCFAWATYVAEVEVDLRTYGVRVTDFVALQEVGKVIHPTLATGQIQGGVAQGIGWALMEEVVVKDGAMVNNQMTNYVIPTAGDLPPLRVFFDEQPSRFGPGGAKGIGELPMDGPAPAILNAVSRALSTSLNVVPLTPERLMQHLDEDGHG